MAIFGFKRVGGQLYRLSAWERAEAWRQKRAAANAKMRSNTASLASAFQAAQVNQVNGFAALTTQLVQSRFQAEAKAKLAKLQKLRSNVDKMV